MLDCIALEFRASDYRLYQVLVRLGSEVQQEISLAYASCRRPFVESFEISWRYLTRNDGSHFVKRVDWLVSLFCPKCQWKYYIFQQQLSDIFLIILQTLEASSLAEISVF